MRHLPAANRLDPELTSIPSRTPARTSQRKRESGCGMRTRTWIESSEAQMLGDRDAASHAPPQRDVVGTPSRAQSAVWM